MNDTIRQAQEQVKKLYKDKPLEALSHCIITWNAFDTTNNIWDAWYYVVVLYKLKKLDEAEKVCTIVHNKILQLNIIFEKAVELFYTSYARVLGEKYLGEIKAETTTDELLIMYEKLLFIASLPGMEKEKAPYEFYTFKWLREAKKRSNILHFSTKVLTLIEKLNPDTLSKDSYTVQLKNGKDSELQSNYEAYYSYKTKALFDLEKYQECIDSCTLALETIEKFHFDNDIWFADRLSNSIAKLGDIDKAILKTEEIVLKKDNWFLFYNLAKLYLQNNNMNEAFKNMLRAAHTKDPIKMKVKLLEDLGNYFSTIDYDLSQKHYILVKKIREENQWPKDDTLLEKITKNLNTNEKELKVEWLEYIYKTYKLETGYIQDSGEKFGNIKQSDKLIFFKTKNYIGDSRNLRPNDKVKFIIVPSYDTKKQKQSKEAIYITKIT